MENLGNMQSNSFKEGTQGFQFHSSLSIFFQLIFIEYLPHAWYYITNEKALKIPAVELTSVTRGDMENVPKEQGSWRLEKQSE